MTYLILSDSLKILLLVLFWSYEIIAVNNTIVGKDSANESRTTNRGISEEKLDIEILDNSTTRGVNLNSTKYHTHISSGSQINLLQNLEVVYEILKNLENKDCIRDIQYVLNGLMEYEKWALQMFDSVPKFPLGLLYGNMYQMGNFDECIGVHHVINRNSSISGQYCLAEIGFKLSTNYSRYSSSENADFKQNIRSRFNTSLLHWGLCLPSTCTPSDGEIIVKGIFTSLIEDFTALEVNIGDKNCNYKKPLDASTGEIVYGCIIAIFLLFIVLATFSHILHLEKRKKCLTYNVESVRKQNELTVINEIVFSFSLIQTVKKLLKTKPTELNLECIYGIKFLSMGFILVGHSLIFILGGPIANVDYLAKLPLDIENSIFLNSPLLVDTFLLISGFLMCRLLLLELDKRRGNINFLVLYITRYIRLTPAYLIVLGFYLTWLPKIGNGPLWKEIIGTENERCLSSWWTNILYINNYVNTDSLCMFQAWYLAADYHLFIIAPFIVYPLWKWKKVGSALLVVSTMFVAILPAYFTWKDNLDPTLLSFPPEIQDLSSNYYFVHAYIKTHMRASSYFLGLIFGYLIHRIQCNGTKIPKWVIWIGWIMSILLAISSMFAIVVFFDPVYNTSPTDALLYAALHRIAWSISIGWIIVVCVTNNAATINKFLTWNFFGPLSRLTYCAYLINGVLVIYHKGTTREAVFLNKYSLIYTATGHLVMTFFCAFFLCICFESPIHGLEKILLRRKDPQQKNGIIPASTLKIVEENVNT